MMNKNDKVLEEQENLNRRLAAFFHEHHIKHFRLISLGNSIASGYSIVRETKPLLLRNNTLPTIMKEHDIELDIHHFARAQNNNDEHVLEWIESNIKESEIHKMNQNDYSNNSTSMRTTGLTEEKIKEYYPTEIENDVGLKDILTDQESNLANIVIYNGATGSFLDGITRGGNLFQQFTHGIKRDISSMEATLKIIQTNNRKNLSNTQVYICGAPNFLGLNISEVINSKLKSLADHYANVIYVEPVKSKLFYDSLNGTGKEIDIHYDEEEYQAFNNKMIESIQKNYQTCQSMIQLDRELYQLNQQIEQGNQGLNPKEIIPNRIEKELQKLSTSEEKNAFLKDLRKYLINRFPYDFYFLGKDTIQNTIEKIQK